MITREQKLSVEEMNIGAGADIGTYFADGLISISEQETPGGTETFLQDVLIGGRSVTVEVGGDIQKAIELVNDAGGGIVYLKDGTHKLANHLTWYNNIEMIGQSAENTTLDFNSGAYQIKAVGTNAYTTGTVSVTNGATAVVGSGTTWTSAMVGRSIMLGGLYYPITAVADTTHLTISPAYAGADLSGDTYVICTPIEGVKISNLKITGSATACIKIQYAREVFFFDVDTQASVVALDIDDSENIQINAFDYVALVSDAIQMTNCHYVSFNSSGGINAGGNGITMSGCSKVVFLASFFMNSTGDGMNLTDCKEIGIVQVAASNGVNGIELVSGCDNVSILNCPIKGNSSDGIKLTGTADRNIINGCVFEDNGGYGINVANANCDANVVTGNSYDNNTSGDVNDDGTDTITIGTTLQGFVVSDNLKESADTERIQDGGTYVKKKEIRVNRLGTVRVKMDLKHDITSGTYYTKGRVYVNGVAVGAEHSDQDTTYTTYSDDIAVSPGDLVQAYLMAYNEGGYDAYIKNFRIYANIDTVDDMTVNTN